MPSKKSKRRKDRKRSGDEDNSNGMETNFYMGIEFMMNNQYQESIRFMKKCLKYARKVGNTKLEEITSFFLLRNYRDLKRYNNAIPHGQRCLQLMHRSGNKKYEMVGSFIMGKIYYEKNEFEQSAIYGERGLICAKELDNKRYQSMIYLLLQDCYIRLNKYKEAIIAGQNCREVSKVIDNTSFQWSLYFSGKTNQNLDQFDDAVNFYLKAIEATLPSENQYVVCFSYLELGKLHYSKSKYDKGIVHLKKALEIAKELEISCLYPHMALADTYLQIGHYENALAHSLKCLKMSKRDRNKHAEMDAYELLGNTFMLKEDWHQALININRAITIMKQSKIENHEEELYLQYGKICKSLQRYNEAVESFHKCVSIARKKENKMLEKEGYVQMANTYEHMNRFDDAVVYGKKYMTLAKEFDKGNDLLEAYLSLGIAYLYLDIYEDAYSNFSEGRKLAEARGNDHYSRLFQEHLDMFTARIGMETSSIKCDDHSVACSFVCSELDLTYFHKYSEAVKQCDFKEAILYLKNHLKEIDRHPFYHGEARVNCLLEISQLHLKIGQVQRALESIFEGLSIANKMESRHLQAKCHFIAGNLHLSHAKTLSDAINSYKQAIHYFDLMFDEFENHRDQYKIALLEMYAECYTRLMEVHICNGQLHEALIICDNSRARALNDQLNTYGIEGKVSQENRLQFCDVKELVSTNEFSLLIYSDHKCAKCGKVCSFLVDKEYGLRCVILSDSENEGNKVENFIYGAFEEMQLFEDIECENRSMDIHLTKNKGKNSIASTRKVVKSRQPPTKSRQCRGNSDATDNPEDENCSQVSDSLQMLHHLLISRPMLTPQGKEEQCIPSQDELVIIPDGSLNSVPFSALQDPNTGEYLSETKRIRIAPSIATLKLLMGRPEDFYCQSGALVIGNPTVGKVICNGVEMEFTPLPRSDVEARVISCMVGVKPLTEENATKAAVIERLHQGVSLIHIAAHGDENMAAIALAPLPDIKASKIPEEEDYMLTMADVQKAQVRAKLVVLSCCHSGRGEIKAEGVVGMCRAFLASGARAVVASLWAIDDEATSQFMVQFYQHLKEGNSASLSLQLAMKHMRNYEEFDHPKFWAPFFLMGDDVTLF